jgi:WD40 repeat protein
MTLQLGLLRSQAKIRTRGKIRIQFNYTSLPPSLPSYHMPFSAVSGTEVVPPAAFSPDGTRIVSRSADKTSRIWDAVSGPGLLVGPLRGHDDWVPFSTRIVSVSQDKTVHIWDAVGPPMRGHDDVVTSAAFSPDDARIVSRSFDNDVTVCCNKNVFLKAPFSQAVVSNRA